MKQSTYLFLLLPSLFILAACHTSKKIIVKTESNEIVPNTLAQDPGKYHDRFEKGIDFIASGNEPFWSLEIDFNKYMHFKTPGELI